MPLIPYSSGSQERKPGVLDTVKVYKVSLVAGLVLQPFLNLVLSVYSFLLFHILPKISLFA